MKKIIGLTFGLLLMIGGFAFDSYGQTKSKPHGINKRQQNQRERIFKGVNSGELTARETFKVSREQYKIQQLENRLRDSGNRLTARERSRLQRELNQASRNIYRQKHDKQDTIEN